MLINNINQHVDLVELFPTPGAIHASHHLLIYQHRSSSTGYDICSWASYVAKTQCLYTKRPLQQFRDKRIHLFAPNTRYSPFLTTLIEAVRHAFDGLVNDFLLGTRTSNQPLS